MASEIENERREYLHKGLSRSDLLADPFEQFDAWLKQAVSAELMDATAMSLATATPDGHPTLRTVLLKYFDHQGFVFYTNLSSKKALQMEQNPNVALLFYWREFERQVKVTGTASKVSTSDSMKYFLSRPRESQLGAWVSEQSSVISTRAVLEQKFEEMKAKFSNKEIPLPSFWGGYRVNVESIEFWQGRANRLHDRFMYTRDSQDHWQIQRLAP
ncbi:MAG: pyridoxamine 5'-phosphate oxidase [Sedimenticola sp.]